MVQYKLKYNDLFYEDLIEILVYIKYNLSNEIAASKLYEEIIIQINKRLENPLDYEKYVSQINKKTFYKIYVNNYTIFYTVDDDVMEVKRILSKKRNLRYLVRDKNVKYKVNPQLC